MSTQYVDKNNYINIISSSMYVLKKVVFVLFLLLSSHQLTIIVQVLQNISQLKIFFNEHFWIRNNIKTGFTILKLKVCHPTFNNENNPVKKNSKHQQPAFAGREKKRKKET